MIEVSTFDEYLNPNTHYNLQHDMMMSSYLLFTLPLLASAIPTLETRFSTNEVVYISRCIADSGANNQLEADYYRDINNSQNGQTPDFISQPQFATSGEPNFNGHHSYTFKDSGVIFTYDAQDNGQAVGQKVGTGSNGKPFTCFKDSSRPLYNRNEQSNRPCNAVFFCRPNYFRTRKRQVAGKVTLRSRKART